MVTYHLYRDAFSEVYTYRYRLTDETGAAQMNVTWPGLPLKERPETVFFDSADGQQRLARMLWEDRTWWYGDRFSLFRAQEEFFFAVVEEQWRIVDRLLLRLPGYRLTLDDGLAFIARGSRYSQQLYEIFTLPTTENSAGVDADSELQAGEVLHPTSGPTYVLRTENPRLESDPILLAALGVILDLWGVRREQGL